MNLKPYQSHLIAAAMTMMCGAAEGAAPPNSIEVKNFTFSPQTLTVSTGDKVSFKFDKPGTYHFTCSIHPRMVGTVVVK